MDINPSKIHEAFQPEDLAGQFILSTQPRYLPPSWRHSIAGRWHLGCESRLPCFGLVDGRGRDAGFLLGFPIDPAGELLTRPDQAVAVPDPEEIEPWLYSLAGRWLAIILTKDFERVYMDPAGSLCAVYCESAGVVATSAGVIPYTPQTTDRAKLVARMPIPHELSMYPVGMTPRYGVQRLIPNHYLDLATWRPQRHWPTAAIATIPDTDAAVSEIIELTRRHIDAVAARYPLQLSLTAGRDSRAIIACARSFLDRVRFFTTAQPDDIGELDVYMARRIARDLHLEHQIIPHETPGDTDHHLWLYRTGCAIGNPSSYEATRLSKHLDPDRAYLTGFLGGVAKNTYGKNLAKLMLEWDGRTITPEHLLTLSLAPRTDETLACMVDWLNGVVLEDPVQILGLFFIEQRVGGWIAINTSAYADAYRLELWPFNSRRIIELMLSFPPEFKKANGLHNTIIAREWPELSAYLVNTRPFPLRVRRKVNYYRRYLAQRMGVHLGLVMIAAPEVCQALSAVPGT
jgi:hypothetical protein